MTNSHESKDRPPHGRSGVALVVVALLLGGLALAADLAWMVPHGTSDAAKASPSAAQEQSSPMSYFPSQFARRTKDSTPPTRLLSE
jgi:hypothetical protein